MEMNVVCSFLLFFSEKKNTIEVLSYLLLHQIKMMFTHILFFIF